MSGLLLDFKPFQFCIFSFVLQLLNKNFVPQRLILFFDMFELGIQYFYLYAVDLGIVLKAITNIVEFPELKLIFQPSSLVLRDYTLQVLVLVILFEVALGLRVYRLFADEFEVTDLLFNRFEVVREVHCQFEDVIFCVEPVFEPSVEAVFGQPNQQIGAEVIELLDASHQTDLLFVKVSLQLPHFFDSLFMPQQVYRLLFTITILLLLLQFLLSKHGQILEYLSAHRFDFFGIQVRRTLFADALQAWTTFRGFWTPQLQLFNMTGQELHDFEHGFEHFFVEGGIESGCELPDLLDGYV